MRAGWRSSRPARVARAFARHGGRAPDDVRHRARAECRAWPCVLLVRTEGVLAWRSMSETTPIPPVAPPGPPVAVDQIVRGRAPTCRPRSSGSSAGALPARRDRVDERPLLVDLVRAREERRVAEHRVEDQPLVRLRAPGPERVAVEEVHVTVRIASPRPAPSRRSRARCPRPAGCGSGARSADPAPAISSKGGAARAGTGSRSSSRGSRAACRRARRTACPPSASCRRRASRRRRSR